MVGGLVRRDEGVHGLVHDGALGAFGRGARGARPVMPPCASPEPGVRMAFVADPEGNLVELLHRSPQGR